MDLDLSSLDYSLLFSFDVVKSGVIEKLITEFDHMYSTSDLVFRDERIYCKNCAFEYGPHHYYPGFVYPETYMRDAALNHALFTISDSVNSNWTITEKTLFEPIRATFLNASPIQKTESVEYMMYREAIAFGRWPYDEEEKPYFVDIYFTCWKKMYKKMSETLIIGMGKDMCNVLFDLEQSVASGLNVSVAKAMLTDAHARFQNHPAYKAAHAIDSEIGDNFKQIMSEYFPKIVFTMWKTSGGFDPAFVAGQLVKKNEDAVALKGRVETMLTSILKPTKNDQKKSIGQAGKMVVNEILVLSLFVVQEFYK